MDQVVEDIDRLSRRRRRRRGKEEDVIGPTDKVTTLPES